MWIGLRAIDNRTWRWVLDGSILSNFYAWNENEPNDWKGPENCVEMLNRCGRWNDKRCSKSNAYVCERKGIKTVNRERYSIDIKLKARPIFCIG